MVHNIGKWVLVELVSRRKKRLVFRQHNNVTQIMHKEYNIKFRDIGMLFTFYNIVQYSFIYLAQNSIMQNNYVNDLYSIRSLLCRYNILISKANQNNQFNYI